MSGFFLWLIMRLNQINEGLRACPGRLVDRYFELLDTEPANTRCADAVELQDVKGRITFENVSF